MVKTNARWFTWIAGLSTVFALCTISCRKGDPFGIIQSDNPPPRIQNIIDYAVSEYEDTLSMVLRFDAVDPVFDRYEYDWSCVLKPAGAPDPVIRNKNKPEATAYGLERGAYQFRIVASNKKGQSQETFSVDVREDTLKGRTIIVPNQKWFVKDSVFNQGIDFYYNSLYLITAPERPDLFFRKLAGMSISYRTEGETEWKSFTDFEVAIVSQKVFWSKQWKKQPNDLKPLHDKKVDLRIYYR